MSSSGPPDDSDYRRLRRGLYGLDSSSDEDCEDDDDEEQVPQDFEEEDIERLSNVTNYSIKSPLDNGSKRLTMQVDYKRPQPTTNSANQTTERRNLFSLSYESTCQLKSSSTLRPKLQRVFTAAALVAENSTRELEQNAMLTDVCVVGRDLHHKSLSALLKHTTLTKLELEDCQLDIKHAKKISKATQLISLKVNKCQITFIGARNLSLCTNLTRLDVSGNNIGLLPATNLLNSLTLVELHLSRCQLTDEALHTSFSNSIRLLTLASNQLSSEVCIGLSKFTNLTCLKLSHNSINGESIGRLTKLQNLKTIELSKCSLDDNWVGMLGALTQLESIDLSNNSLSSIDWMIRLIRLRKLRIDCNRLDANALCQLNSTCLTSLDVSCNHMNEPLVKFELALQQHKLSNIRYLRASSNQLNDIHMRQLASHLTQLQVLDVSTNMIGDAGTSALAAHRSLWELNISNNQLSTSSAYILSRSLVLSRIDLANNNSIDANALHAFTNKLNLIWLGYSPTNDWPLYDKLREHMKKNEEEMKKNQRHVRKLATERASKRLLTVLQSQPKADGRKTAIGRILQMSSELSMRIKQKPTGQMGRTMPVGDSTGLRADSFFSSASRLSPLRRLAKTPPDEQSTEALSLEAIQRSRRRPAYDLIAIEASQAPDRLILPPNHIYTHATGSPANRNQSPRPERRSAPDIDSPLLPK